MPTSTTPNIIVAVKRMDRLPAEQQQRQQAPSVTVTWVMTERDSVELTEALSISAIGIFL